MNARPGLVVDLFAGGGGASTGLEAALKRPVDVAINHSEVALAVHAANHPETRHIRTDIFDVKPKEVAKGRPVDVLWASPDCFPAGTMVLTRDGYRPIEQIKVGDEVLTHLQRWRKVTATMSTVRPLVKVRGHGHPGLVVSPEHPFFARKVTQEWRTNPRGYDRVWSRPDWVKAADLKKGHYWATPTAFPEDAPPAIPTVGERQTDITPALMWLVGRYIADGSTRLDDTHAELTISVGSHKVEAFRAHIAAWEPSGPRAKSNELSWQERDMTGCVQFTTSHRGLVSWLRENFGSGCEHKFVPGWALGMAVELRQALLDGYLSGDGYVAHGQGNAVVESTTVSKALAFGVKALAESLGKTVTVYVQKGSNVILGRTVNVLPLYRVRWRSTVDSKHAQTKRDQDHLEWSPIRKCEGLNTSAEVFNISVEEDETYVVEGVVVHNCRHFSRAKGGKPASKRVRSLAWVVTAWANDVRPRVIFLENVEEFRTWGPLDKDGQPQKDKAGQTFRKWVRRLERLGYVVEHRVLDASHYGAPTKRKRLFVVARCDGLPIRWPTPTHGTDDLFGKPVRTAAECIDWSLPCPSIFERERPLADKTLRRVAAGIRRFVLEDPKPFLVKVNHGGPAARVEDLGEPLTTVTAARRGHALVMPSLIEIDHGSNRPTARSTQAPLSTVTAEARHALVVPALIQTGYGERQGQAPRVLDLHEPLGTVMAQGQKHALVAAFLAKHFGGVVGQRADKPTGTITTKDHHGLVAATLVKLRGQCAGASVKQPMPTLTAGGTHIAEVRAFLTAYYGEGCGQSLNDPARTITTRDRLGLVTVDSIDYQIVDIGLRMLEPEELLRAQFGTFAEGYDLSAAETKADKVRLVGNSVCPDAALALVRANVRRAALVEVAHG